MNTFQDKSKNQIAKEIIRNFGEGDRYNILSTGSNPRRKIKIRRLVQSIKKQKSLIVLEQKGIESQKWEIVYSDITLISKNFNGNMNNHDYQYIGFDIYMDLLNGLIYKSILINFSYHSLIRIIERCNLKILNSPIKVKSFLSSMLKTVLLRCLTMYETLIANLDHASFSIEELLKEKVESYVVVESLFLPIVMEIGKDKYGKIAFLFTIKTVMPESFNGAQRSIKENNLEKTKEYIFDYYKFLEPLAR